jgi:hypothetical protein
MSKYENIPIPEGNDVYWEPWIDAYDNEELNSAKMLYEQQFQEYLEDMLESKEDYVEEEDQAHQEQVDLGDELSMFERPIKTIITPFGVLPLTETSLASSHFKFWVGHTNFKILDRYVDIIESCPGVETIDVLTPYRFRIAIAKLFRDRDVMHSVKQALVNVAE